MPLLLVDHVSKAYPGLPVLDDVSLQAEEGEILSLLGPSGCGKTTLLRIVAGLELPDRGQVLFAGRDLAGVPVHRRGFGMMFQDFALFPHRDVFENVAFGLRMQGQPAAEIVRRVGEALDLVHLAGYEQRRVTELSGGEQQRVALARSLAPGPRLLMLDEPLGSLDRTLREEVMNELRDILKRVGVTALYVTHDQQEAFAIADRVLVMRPDAERGGRVEQAGTPQEVYRRPATAFVARFLGFHNLLPATVSALQVTANERWQASAVRQSEIIPHVGPGISEEPIGPVAASAGVTEANLCRVETPVGLLWAPAAGSCVTGDALTLLVRPEAAQVRPAGTTGFNTISGIIQETSFRGGFYLVRTSHLHGIDLTWTIAAANADLPAPGKEVTLALDPHAMSLLLREHR